MERRFPFGWLLRGMSYLFRTKWIRKLAKYSSITVISMVILWQVGGNLLASFLERRVKQEIASGDLAYNKLQALPELKENESARQIKEIFKGFDQQGSSFDDEFACGYIFMLNGGFSDSLTQYDNPDADLRTYMDALDSGQSPPSWLDQQKVLDYIKTHSRAIKDIELFLSDHDAPQWELRPSEIKSNSRPSPQLLMANSTLKCTTCDWQVTG